jgi:hypothetical protein
MYTTQYLLENKNNSSKYINKCMDKKQKMINVIVKHCIKLLNKLKRDKDYQDLLLRRKTIKNKSKLSKKDKSNLNDINNKLKEIRINYKLDKNELQKYVKVQQLKYKNYISSQEAQIISDDVWCGVEKVLYGEGKWLHFKKKGDCNTLQAKSLLNGIKFDGQYIYLSLGKNKIQIKVIVKDYDLYGQQAMSGKLKYCRLVRQIFNSGYRYYIQLIFDGVPPLKITSGIGESGIDIGVSSIAAVTDSNCILEDLAPDINKYNKLIIKYQKRLERSKRLNNKDNYNSDGTIKKNVRFQKTKNYFKILFKLKTLYRKRKCYVDQTQNKIINQIISESSIVYYEEMNFKALQKRAKELKKQDKDTTIITKSGESKTIIKYKRKKRFGKTLNNKSPSSFLTKLIYKCKFLNVECLPIHTQKFKASQYNHITNKYIKKELKERWNTFNIKGIELKIQRDLYSAYLIKNTNTDLDKPDRKKCKKEFKGFIKLHNECIEKVKTTNNDRLSCFGF